MQIVPVKIRKLFAVLKIRILFVLALVSLLLTLLLSPSLPFILRHPLTFRPQSHVTSAPTSLLVTSSQCRDVLRNMVKGRWHQRAMTSGEIERMRVFHRRVREEEHHIPKGVQRPDKKCGNVNVGTGGMLHFFKGLCDPDGDVPCCYDYHCVNRTKEQCDCDTCQDMRKPIHAEYATWRPNDPACAPRNWTSEEICRLLHNSTIHFVGDSLVRHVFTAVLLAVRGNFESGAFRANIPKNLRSWCSGLYMFSEKVCRLWLDENTTVCNGTVVLKNFHLLFARQAPDIHKAVLRLANVSRSLVVLGVGFHDQFAIDPIKDKVLRPLLDILRSRSLRYPNLLWANVHKFGMMRTPLTKVDNSLVQTYNGAVQQLLQQYGVPVLDTYQLPDNVMSFDGQHYGYGVNTVKVSILLHYIQQLQAQGRW